MLVITPVDKPRASACSRIVSSAVPSDLPRTASADSEMTPLPVFWPVTMADMPAAESVTQRSEGEVSINAMCGIC